MRLVAALIMLVFATSSQAGPIIISEVYPSGSASTYNADWFELTNTGPTDIDITGWKIDDNSNAFASSVALRGLTNLPAGKSAVFLEGNTVGDNDATKAANFLTAWFGSSILPDGFLIGGYGGSGVSLSGTADAVNIYNAAGVLQANVSFAATTAGFTFDNAAGLDNSAISQLSVDGVNGAFLSFNGAETGSPGTIATVPEPSSMILVGFAVVGVVGRRFRRKASINAVI